MKLYVDRNLNLNSNKINILSAFCAYCADQLSINEPFKVYVVSNRNDHGISTTAVYEVKNNVCRIYGKDRAMVDVCRSIAHEMTHMMQDACGLLVGHIQDAGGFHEDQANAKAGEIIKRFAKSHPSRKMIYESKIIF